MSKAPELKVKEKIYAIYEDGFVYSGVVLKKEGTKYKLKLEDGDTATLVRTKIMNLAEYKAAKKAGNISEDGEWVDEVEEEEEETEEEEEESDEEEVDLEQLDRKELVQLIKEQKLKIKVTAKMKDAAIRKAIEAELGGNEEEAEEEESEEVDLSEMSRKELKAYITDNELEIKVTQKMSDDDIREAISELQGDTEEEEEEEEETEEEESEESEEEEEEEEESEESTSIDLSETNDLLKKIHAELVKLNKKK